MRPTKRIIKSSGKIGTRNVPESKPLPARRKVIATNTDHMVGIGMGGAVIGAAIGGGPVGALIGGIVGALLGSGLGSRK